MISSQEVRVRLSQLRTAADNLNNAADHIDSAVETTNGIIDSLMARGFVSEAATAFHSRFLNNTTWMDEWPGHVRDFAVKLTEAADEIEEAVGSDLDVDDVPDTDGQHGNQGQQHGSNGSGSDGGAVPPIPPVPGGTTGGNIPSSSGTSSHSGNSGHSSSSSSSSSGGSHHSNQNQNESDEAEEPEAPPEQPPLESYMSGANRQLYDEMEAKQGEVTSEQQNLDFLHTRRQQLQEQLDDLTHRLEEAGASTSNARTAALQAEIAVVDGQIAASEARIADLQAGVTEIQTRLERVRPAAGADLELIASLEGTRTIDAILNATRQADNSINCVNWVCSRMPIPPGIPGNAMTWIDNAAAHPELGITVGSVPLAGSVIVMQPEHSFANDIFGHVMYVERVENGAIWVTDNFHHDPVLLSDMTDELTGPNIQYMYFPWQTRA
jgi:hypothetical protein